MTRLLRVIVAAGAALLAMAASAPAQMQGPLQGQYPNKPVTLIVPFGPGSATDTISRIIAQHLGQALNQSIVIENKPGANGAIAAAYVAARRARRLYAADEHQQPALGRAQSSTRASPTIR